MASVPARIGCADRSSPRFSTANASATPRKTNRRTGSRRQTAGLRAAPNTCCRGYHAKRDALEAAYGAVLSPAKAPYETAARIFASTPGLDSAQTRQYQHVVGRLADIADFNVFLARSRKAPDLSGLQAEQKKWSDLYESLK